MTGYLHGRQAIYEYFYMAYYKIPDARFVEITRQFCDVFTALGVDTGGTIATGAEMLSGFLNENKHIADEELAVRLNVAFTKLFNKADSSVCLLENRWRQAEKAKEDIIIPISNYFADADVVKPIEINMPIDSYSMELFFLYHTSRAAAESEGEARDKIISGQLNFMKEHILCWTDKFTDAVLEKTDKLNVFHALAYLSNGFLKYDFSVLEDLSGIQEGNKGV